MQWRIRLGTKANRSLEPLPESVRTAPENAQGLERIPQIIAAVMPIHLDNMRRELVGKGSRLAEIDQIIDNMGKVLAPLAATYLSFRLGALTLEKLETEYAGIFQRFYEQTGKTSHGKGFVSKIGRPIEAVSDWQWKKKMTEMAELIVESAIAQEFPGQQRPLKGVVVGVG